MTMWTPLNTALVIIACTTVFMLEASIFVSGLIGVFFARKATEAQRALAGIADAVKGKTEDKH